MSKVFSREIRCNFVFMFFLFRAKLNEIKTGADGFLVFDPDLVQPLIQVSNLVCN